MTKIERHGSKPKYILGSSQLFHAPGIWRWAVNGYKFPRDRAALRKVIVEGWRIPPEVAHDALMGKIPVVVTDSTVEIYADGTVREVV